MTSTELNSVLRLSDTANFEWMEFGGPSNFPYVLHHFSGGSGGACKVAGAYLVAKEPDRGIDLSYRQFTEDHSHWLNPVYLHDTTKVPTTGIWCSLRFYFDEDEDEVKRMVAEAVGMLVDAVKHNWTVER